MHISLRHCWRWNTLPWMKANWSQRSLQRSQIVKLWWNKNAICLQNFQRPIKLDTRHYGIPLKNTLYKLSHFTTLATAKPSIVLFAFSFRRTDDTFTDEDAYIFTNKNTSRGVTISRKALNILGADDRLELHYDYNDWNTMIIQYSLITDSEKDECFFMLNGRRGFFYLVLWENKK